MFTYANAKVTSALVKLLKNTGIPIFSTKLFYFFLLPIKKVRRFQAKVRCGGYSVKAIKHLCMSTMR